jgi:hypothetical protein
VESEGLQVHTAIRNRATTHFGREFQLFPGYHIQFSFQPDRFRSLAKLADGPCVKQAVIMFLGCPAGRLG